MLSVAGTSTVILLVALVTVLTAKRDEPSQTAAIVVQDQQAQAIAPAPLSPEDSDKIDRLLAAAEAHAAIGRIVDPPGSNAYEAYLMVLDIDPANLKAMRGVAAIEKLPDFQERHVVR